VVRGDEGEDGIGGRVTGKDDCGDVVGAGVDGTGGFFVGDYNSDSDRKRAALSVLDEVEKSASRAREEDGEAGEGRWFARGHLIASAAAAAVG
jgi:hypothetical protein